MSRSFLKLSGLALLCVASAFAQMNVTGNIAAGQVTSGTFNISLIPTGTSGTTVALGNDSRFLNATKLNGTDITTLTGLLKLTSGTPSNAAAADIGALFGCTAGTPLLSYNGTTASCVSAGGTGTVTSVALTSPNFFTVSGSPVTGSGTLAFAYATGLTANQVLATDASGAAGLRALTGAMLPNPSSSTLGGIQSFAAVAHNFITSISTSGVPAAAQPSFADISGTAASTQLPAPTASAIGGVKAYTAVSNQFLTSIDTSGTPASAQPSFANLSGTVTAAQMPTNSQVWTKYTVPFTSAQTASTTNAVTVVSLTAKQLVCGVVEKHTTAFAGTSISGLTVTVGDSNGTSTTYSPVAFNLLQTVSNTAFVANNVLGMASFAGGTVQANFTSSGANLSALTAGSLDIDVCITTLP
jgi:hypothetical protein